MKRMEDVIREIALVVNKTNVIREEVTHLVMTEVAERILMKQNVTIVWIQWEILVNKPVKIVKIAANVK